MKQIDLKDQYFGTEIEMTGISRYNAAAAVGRMFGTEPYSIRSYSSWCVKDPDGKVWKFSYDSSIHNHRGESSGVLVEEPPRAVLTPAKEKVRQNGRRMKGPEEPMFTITATDRHGVIYHGRIRRLTPRECLRLQGYRDDQISKMEKETSDNQLYKQAGNGVTVNVIEAIGRNLKAVDEEIRSGSPVPEVKGG